MNLWLSYYQKEQPDCNYATNQNYNFIDFKKYIQMNNKSQCYSYLREYQNHLEVLFKQPTESTPKVFHSVGLGKSKNSHFY